MKTGSKILISNICQLYHLRVINFLNEQNLSMNDIHVCGDEKPEKTFCSEDTNFLHKKLPVVFELKLSDCPKVNKICIYIYFVLRLHSEQHEF